MIERMNMPESGTRIRESIIQILTKMNSSYELTRHHPVYTMEQAHQANCHLPEEGVKSLLVRLYASKSQYNFGLIVWRGDRQVPWKTIAETVRVKKVSMASEREVEEQLGIRVGALAPLGYSTLLPVIFDVSLLNNQAVYINPGRHDETIKMKAHDLLTAIQIWVGTEQVVTQTTS